MTSSSLFTPGDLVQVRRNKPRKDANLPGVKNSPDYEFKKKYEGRIVTVVEAPYTLLKDYIAIQGLDGEGMVTIVLAKYFTRVFDSSF